MQVRAFSWSFIEIALPERRLTHLASGRRALARFLIGQRVHDAEAPDLHGEIVHGGPKRVAIRTGDGATICIPWPVGSRKAPDGNT